MAAPPRANLYMRHAEALVWRHPVQIKDNVDLRAMVAEILRSLTWAPPDGRIELYGLLAYMSGYTGCSPYYWKR